MFSHIINSGLILLVVLHCTAALVHIKKDSVKEETLLFDFRSESFTEGSLALWSENSDTQKSAGLSKGSLAIQKTQVFQRAVFFSMLKLQDNGVGYAGYSTDISLAEYTGYTGIIIKARSQGQLSNWKIFVKELQEDNVPSPFNYEFSFAMNNASEDFEYISMPFADFKAYLNDGLVNTRPVKLEKVILLGVQAHGGHNLDYEQSGVGSLEIDYIALY